MQGRNLIVQYLLLEVKAVLRLRRFVCARFVVGRIALGFLPLLCASIVSIVPPVPYSSREFLYRKTWEP